jgi:two-component system KDP operon response regulator KdpE
VLLNLILVIDDDPGIGAAVRAALSDAAHSVVVVATGAEGIRVACESSPDVIVLDLGLPDADGGEVCRQLRPILSAPIIVISARTDVAEKVRLFELGADDFVTKPFSLRELEVRIQAHLRRRAMSAAVDRNLVAHADGLVIDVARNAVFRNDKRIGLTRSEWSCLRALLDHAGKPLTHRQLSERVWNLGWDKRPELLRFHVTNLRRKIEREPANPRIVIAEPGVGYRLALDGDL